MDPFTLLIGAQVAGGIFSFLSSKNQADVERQRFQDFLAELDASKREELSTGTRLIGEQIRSQMADASAMAARRAAASGRTDLTEQFTVPATSNVAATGSRQLREFVQNVNTKYSNARIGASRDYQERPIPMDLADIGSALATGVSRYATNKQLLDIYQGQLTQGMEGGVATPSAPTTEAKPQNPEQMVQALTPAGLPKRKRKGLLSPDTPMELVPETASSLLSKYLVQ